MKELQTVLNNILADKNTNLKSENLKKGVTCLGVTGTLEANTTSGGVKLFKTQEAMQADATAQEGDLATVYRNEIKTISNGDVITSITFPKTVVFDTAITSDYNGRLGNSSKPRIYLSIQLDASRFMLYDMNNTIREIEYSSTDGITYNRTDSNEDTYEIGETTVEDLDEHICKFMQVGGNVFEGLYENKIDINIIQFLNLLATSFSNIDLVNKDATATLNNNDKHSLKIDKSKLLSVLKANDISTAGCCLFVTSNNELMYTGSLIPLYDTTGSLLGYALNGSFSNTSSEFYKINLDNSTVTQAYTKSASNHLYASSSSDNYYYLSKDEIDCVTLPTYINSDTNTYSHSLSIVSTDSNNPLQIYVFQLNYDYQGTSTKYYLAPTQLTTLSDEVYQSIFYGKNGVETGILTEKVSNLFTDLNAKIYSEIQNAYDNMKPRILTDTDNDIDNNILFVPVKSDGTPLLDTSNMTNMHNLFAYHQKLIYVSSLNTSSVVNMAEMFSNCSSLKIVGLLDTSKVTMMYNMFDSCRSLISIPLLDTSKVTEMNNMFNHCTSLSEIPQLDISKATSIAGMFSYCSSLKEIPQLDTSNATNTGAMFRNCTALETVPLMNISKTTNLVSMFEGCTSLSDESLNNILGMCISATSYTDTKTKTLKYIGLTEEQTNKCKTLSNYTAFTTAGWTTGY